MNNANPKQSFRRLDKSLRFQKIVETAAELFHKKGYRSTTLEDVAKRLGITKAAIYTYVPSKVKLLSMIYMQAFERILQDLHPILERNISPSDKLSHFIRHHIENILIPSVSMYHVFFSEDNQLPESDFREIRRQRRKYNDILERILEEGISKSVFSITDARLASYGIIGMCNWVYKWYDAGKKYYTPDQIADCFINLIQVGVLGIGDKEKHEVRGKSTSKAMKRGGKPVEAKDLSKMKSTAMELLKEIERLVSHTN